VRLACTPRRGLANPTFRRSAFEVLLPHTASTRTNLLRRLDRRLRHRMARAHGPEGSCSRRPSSLLPPSGRRPTFAWFIYIIIPHPAPCPRCSASPKKKKNKKATPLIGREAPRLMPPPLLDGEAPQSGDPVSRTAPPPYSPCVPSTSAIAPNRAPPLVGEFGDS